MTHPAHAAAVEALVAAAGKLPGSPFLLSLAEGDALARTYLAALAERGFKVVPREADLDAPWLLAGARSIGHSIGEPNQLQRAREALRSMHDAAPTWPPTAD